MKILYVNTNIYDFLTATLIEGLIELGHEVVTSEKSNFGQGATNRHILHFAEKADLIIIGSGPQVRSWLMRDIGNPNLIFVDGSDKGDFEVNPFIQFKAVFKRELCIYDVTSKDDRIFPLPFSAEKRYFINPLPSGTARDIKVFFGATLSTNPIRYSIHHRLMTKNDSAIFSGSTGERSYKGKIRGHYNDTPQFRELLFRSQVGINAAGAGWDCARYWEILAAGALLFTQKLEIVIPNPLIHGQHCLEFNSLDEFDSRLDELLTKPHVIPEIARAGYEHVQQFHTSSARAAFFLKHALGATKRNGYCTRFFKGPQRHPFLKKYYYLLFK